ncbi:hypothetical protein [Pectobacterium polaris]|uniref:hypothetical protein n=1 Tax=Pectobacterium polaris TaxID=2042057 RepID=UPI0020BF6AD4|nr:hypothetical protein [Pectobacterium polaris]
MPDMQLITKITIRLLFLLSTLLSVAALSGCGDKNEREFIRGCKSGGGTTAICGCILDDLKTKYTHGELEKMNQQYGYAPPRFMENMLSAAQQCRK